MRILAFDPSQTRTGWAVFDESGPLSWGHFEYTPWGNSEPYWICKFHVDVTELVLKHKPDEVAYEQTFLPKGPIRQKVDTFASRFSQFALVATIMLVSEQNSLPVSQAIISDWRKRFLGTSRAPVSLTGSQRTKWFKEQAITVCNQRGWSTAEPDEAEALGIGDFVMCCRVPAYKEMTDEIATKQRDFFKK